MPLWNKTPKTTTPKITTVKKETLPTIITREVNLLGNLISDGVVDFDGTIDGNIRCQSLTVRPNGTVNGEVNAENLFVYGKINGLVRAKNVNLCSGCHIEGIIMHESISIEDGAFIDGTCKRSDKIKLEDEDAEGGASGNLKLLENIRLIR